MGFNGFLSRNKNQIIARGKKETISKANNRIEFYLMLARIVMLN